MVLQRKASFLDLRTTPGHVNPMLHLFLSLRHDVIHIPASYPYPFHCQLHNGSSQKDDRICIFSQPPDDYQMIPDEKLHQLKACFEYFSISVIPWEFCCHICPGPVGSLLDYGWLWNYDKNTAKLQCTP